MGGAIIGAILGAIGGGIGFALGGLLTTALYGSPDEAPVDIDPDADGVRTTRPIWPRQVLTVVGVVIALQFIGPVSTLIATPNEEDLVTQAIAGSPTFEALREHEPELFERVLTNFTDSNGEYVVSDDTTRAGREIIAENMSRWVTEAPDHRVVDLMKLAVDQYQALLDSPLICRSLINGTAGDLRVSFGRELVARDETITAALISEAAGETQRHASVEDMDAFYIAAVQELIAQETVSQEELLAALGSTGDPALQCRATIYIIRRMAALPEDQAAAMFRTTITAS